MRDGGGILLLAPVRLCWFGASKRYSREPDLVAQIFLCWLGVGVQQGHAQIIVCSIKQRWVWSQKKPPSLREGGLGYSLISVPFWSKNR